MARTFLIAVFSSAFCLSQLTMGGEPAAARPATVPQVQQTVERAIGYLQSESGTWLKTRRCAACHHAAMPLWALSEAGGQGYTVDKKFVTDSIEGALGSRKKMMASGLVPNPDAPPDPRPMARGVNTGAVFMAAIAGMMPSLTDGQKNSLNQIIDDIIKKQQPDGSWEFFLSRPPINESKASDAAWIILALQGQVQRDPSESHRAALERAIAWLEGPNLPDNQQMKALKLLVAIRAGRPREELQPAIDQLLALQRPDGGWNQTPAPMSDAFATGQTLYVLALAGYTSKRPEIQNGINFLVARQKSDGSWPMASRATPDGRPGSAKLLTPITCAADSWATLALSRLVPKNP
ncbi:MAG TPA: prenyltransferase/squalene oxidase repeat-containing protein [Tepidisphaeraceae bacterium]|nr:prenyltransferase/squalene oxidase repeat-containing protein [Tepidisphaeraceae bacterium]